MNTPISMIIFRTPHHSMYVVPLFFTEIGKYNPLVSNTHESDIFIEFWIFILPDKSRITLPVAPVAPTGHIRLHSHSMTVHEYQFITATWYALHQSDHVPPVAPVAPTGHVAHVIEEFIFWKIHCQWYMLALLFKTPSI